MLFSYNWLQSFFQKKLPKPEKLADYIMMHTLEVEEIKKRGNDWVLDIDVLPDRMSDCSSHFGIAKEISAILGYKIKEKKYLFQEDKKVEAADNIKIEVKDRNLCSRYCARIINGVKVSQSPRWLKEKLESCGLQSINNVVDATNYIMLEIGQPIHAFDFDKISVVQNQKLNAKDKKAIIIRRARTGEKITTLEEKRYNLDKDVLVIADKEEPIAIAGIKGGKKAEIDKGTKTIIIESANFERKSIYKTSKKLKLKTDASVRFSAGLDPNLAEEAVNKVSSLIVSLAGGKTAKGVVDVYPKKNYPQKIKLDFKKISSILGLELPQNKAIKILKSLGFDIKNPRGDFFDVIVPTIRRDISIQEDLIEEIGRIYGYEKLPTRFSILQKAFPKKNKELLVIRETREIMKGLGFNETYNYSFVSEKDRSIFNKQKSELFETQNPISSNTKYLRFSLLPNLLKAIKNNQKRFQGFKFFEIGNIFLSNQEKRNFAAVITGKDNFYKIKGIFEAVIKELRITGFSYRLLSSNQEIWEKRETAEIKNNDKSIGFIGEISKKITNFYQIKNPVFAFEVDFKKLLSCLPKKEEYVPPPIYPPIIQDISIIVPKTTLSEEIKELILRMGRDIVKDVEIFDIYEGNPLSEKEKSISFHVFYQSEKRTLSSKEVDKVKEKTIKEIEKNFQWKVRR